MWHPRLTKYVSNVPCNNFRLQATKFSFPAGPLLVVNCYFPCDPQNDRFDDSELIEILSQINTIRESADCSSILLAGDLNCDFGRNNRFIETVQEYCCNTNIEVFGTPSGRIAFNLWTLHI